MNKGLTDRTLIAFCAGCMDMHKAMSPEHSFCQYFSDLLRSYELVEGRPTPAQKKKFQENLDTFGEDLVDIVLGDKPCEKDVIRGHMEMVVAAQEHLKLRARPEQHLALRDTPVGLKQGEQQRLIADNHQDYLEFVEGVTRVTQNPRYRMALKL